MKITPQLEKYQTENVQICKIFAERFRDLRRIRRLTLRCIAIKLGISRQSIVYYAMGDRIPSIPILISIAALLNTSVDYLLGVTDSQNPQTPPIKRG